MHFCCLAIRKKSFHVNVENMKVMMVTLKHKACEQFALLITNHRLLSLAGIENDTYPISTNLANFAQVAKVRLEMQIHVQNRL